MPPASDDIPGLHDTEAQDPDHAAPACVSGPIFRRTVSRRESVALLEVPE